MAGLSIEVVDDEVLIDASASTAPVSSIVVPLLKEADDTEMHIDEEGRPKFAPAKAKVCIPSLQADAFVPSTKLSCLEN